jgi:hypothetical protein
MFIDIFRNLIGQPPLGYEALEYIISAVLFLILFDFVANIFKQFQRFFSGR